MGCSKTESDNIKTNGMKADIDITATGNGKTGIKVNISVGSGGISSTEVELSSGDTLTATDGTTTKELYEDDGLLGDIEYKTEFSTEAEDTLFTVSLVREDGENAENSFVTLPAPFTLSSESSEITGDGYATVDLSWTNCRNNYNVAIEVDCTCSRNENGQSVDTIIYNDFPDITDDGEEQYGINRLLGDYDPTRYDLGCDIELTMERSRLGTLDSGFGEGGSIEAVQKRTINFTYTPAL
jgi:hypothetical protein